MEAPRVRDALPADTATISAVHLASHRSAYRGIAPDAFLDAPDRAERYDAAWRERVARPGVHLWVAERDGAPVGFCGIDLDGGEETGLPQLNWIHVAPAAIGTGVGIALWRHAMGALRDGGHAEAVLWVIRENERARGFYERRGWRPDGAARRHDWPPTDEHSTDVRYRGSTAAD